MGSFCRLRAAAITLAVVACALAQEGFTQKAVALDIERTGVLSRYSIGKSNLNFNGSAELTADVQYLFRASTLMREPLVNCGVRLSNVAGTVTFNDQDQPHTVTIGPENAHLLRFYHVDLMVHYEPGYQRLALICNAGIVADEETEPFNIATSPNWGSLYCAGRLEITNDLPDRLNSDWCEAAGGLFLNAGAAEEIFGREGLHNSSTFTVGSVSLAVSDLWVAEAASLRAARESAEEVEADGPIAVGLNAALDRINQARRADPAEATADPLDDSAQQPSNTRDPMIAAMAARIAAERESRTPEGTDCTRQVTADCELLIELSPDDGTTVSSPVAGITGRVNPDHVTALEGRLVLMVGEQDQRVDLRSDGSFSTNAVLASGDNLLALVLVDPAAGDTAGAVLARRTIMYSGRPTRLRVTLTWDTSGSDIDLHVSSPGGHTVNYRNKSAGYLRLNVDNTNGYGPENISTEQAESGSYAISVVNFARGAGTTATLHIYKNERLERRDSHLFTAAGEHWDAGTVEFD